MKWVYNCLKLLIQGLQRRLSCFLRKLNQTFHIILNKLSPLQPQNNKLFDVFNISKSEKKFMLTLNILLTLFVFSNYEFSNSRQQSDIRSPLMSLQLTKTNLFGQLQRPFNVYHIQQVKIRKIMEVLVL